MNIYIVDASVAAKWFTDEEFTDSALLLLREGKELHVPDFFFLEMDNLFCKWMRRELISEREGREIRAGLSKIPLQKHPALNLRDLAFSIANQTRLSFYDCLYASLAILLKGRLVTADRKMYDCLSADFEKISLLWVEDLK